MSEQRPRYGEFATPEEQRQAAGLPPVSEIAPIAAEPAASHPVAAPPRPRLIDRLVTIALLAYGFVSVVMSAFSYLDLPRLMNETMKILGIDGEFTNFAQGRLWGTIAAVVLVLGWTITAVISVRRLRARRSAWWVPIAGAAVTVTLSSLCLAVAMMGDPAFVDYISRSAS